MTTWTRLVRCLLPPPQTIQLKHGHYETDPDLSTMQKVVYYTKNFFTLIALLLVSPLTLIYDYFAHKKITVHQREPDIAPPQPTWPPEYRGFASSGLQTSGLGTKWSATPHLKGKCDWDKWMDIPAHVIHAEGFDYKDFFTDILSNPTAYIKMLKSQNTTALRFSLEWSVIEPQPGKIDEKAVALYRTFIDQLLEAKITPFITLCHFVVPEWFYESGNFLKTENIDRFVQFALRAMELFPKVKDWWSFNEIGIKSFQQMRGVYPTDLPQGSSLSRRVHAAGISTRNMLMAHCRLHQAVAKRFPDRKVGVTHQWLKMDTAKGNWLEKLSAYYVTKFCFTPVYQFFKEGRYSFEFPFMANIQFVVPKEEFEDNNHFLMRIGVQAYPMPMVKVGLTRGQTYPGIEGIRNRFFTMGATCEPGGVLMRFGPRWRASGMDEILDEAFELKAPVYITEYGSDAKIQKWGNSRFKIDDEAQAYYLQQLTERIRDYSLRTSREIKGLFCWSDLRRQLEWENGHECKLGIVEPIVNEKRQMIGWTPTPASKYLANAYRPEEASSCSLTA
ncbi:MAG: beta-glucosidase [Parachlamydiales bacterium]|nr:beta-glucosidase [Parachlamydiales bacterium]